MISVKQSYLNILYALIERVTQLALSVLSIIFVTKSLSVNHYAIYGYALSLAQLSSIFTILIANDYIVKTYLNWSKNHAENLFIQFFMVRIILIFIFYFFAVFFVIFFNPLFFNNLSTIVLIIFAFVMLIEESFGVFLSYYVAIGNQKTITRVRLLSGFVKVVLIFLLYRLDSNNVIYFATASLVAALLFGIQIFKLYSTVNNSFSKFYLSHFKSIILKGFHFSIGASLILLMTKIDRQIAHSTLNEYEFGSYSLAMQFVEQWLGLSIAAASLIAPRLFFNLPRVDAFNNCIKFFLIFLGFSFVGTLIMRQFIIPILWPLLNNSVNYNISYFQTLIWISIPFFSNQVVYYYQLYAENLTSHYIIYVQALLFLIVSVFFLKISLESAVLFTNLNILVCNIIYLINKYVNFND